MWSYGGCCLISDEAKCYMKNYKQYLVFMDVLTSAGSLITLLQQQTQQHINITKDALKIKGPTEHIEVKASCRTDAESTNWLEGFRVMSRNDRFTCQQTFAVHRSTNVQRYMLGVKMCITAIPRSTRQISSCLRAASQSPSVYLSYKHFPFFIELTWPNNINNSVSEQYVTSPNRGRWRQAAKSDWVLFSWRRFPRFSRRRQWSRSCCSVVLMLCFRVKVWSFMADKWQ